MLSHNNIVSNIKAVLPVLPLNQNMRVLSFLPLCHIFERVVVYVYMVSGVSVYYAESMETIADNLKEVKPNFFTSVPRLLEKVYIKLQGAAANLDGWKKSLYYSALDFAQNFDVEKQYGIADNVKRAVYDKLIYSKWREALGGNCQGICTGAAALNPLLARVFTCAGIPIMEGYGQTESSPVISINPFALDRIKFGTVGIPVENSSVRIAEEDGEILMKGPSLMMGYYKNPEATSEVIDSEGWFHTGDIGKMIDGKFLKITDRKKEIFKNSGGKYISPMAIENKLKECRYIEQCMVVGEGQKFVSAIIIPSLSAFKEYCEQRQVEWKDREQMLTHDDLKRLIADHVKKMNTTLAAFEQVKRYQLIDANWRVETGEITPKLSLRRKVIASQNKEVIQKIFGAD
jgi:long-chain acyl-CoA synthetase